MAEKDNSSTDEPAKVKTAPYQLTRRFWDNTRVHKKGEVLDFVVSKDKSVSGRAPRGAILLTELQAKKLRGQNVEAALDPVQSELVDLRAQVAALMEATGAGAKVPEKVPTEKEPTEEEIAAAAALKAAGNKKIPAVK